MKKRISILISGRGSNMEAILNASRSEGFPGEVVLVVSDQEGAKGLLTAKSLGIEAKAVARSDFRSKSEHEQAISSLIEESRTDLICLAGYMRILSAEFVHRFAGRLINIHPSLLPDYKGLDTHSRVLEDKANLHGCSVHFVNAEMDGGAIIAQAAVAVLKTDTEDQLAKRVLAKEHLLYPKIVKLVCSGQITLQDNRVNLKPSAVRELEAAGFSVPV